MPLRVASPLSAEVEAVVTRIIGAAIAVHEQLGPGLKEAQYEDALKIEIAVAGLKFKSQRRVVVTYRSQSLRAQRIDLIVEGQVLDSLSCFRAVLFRVFVHRAFAMILTYEPAAACTAE
jgi:GxxExxY protein